MKTVKLTEAQYSALAPAKAFAYAMNQLNAEDAADRRAVQRMRPVTARVPADEQRADLFLFQRDGMISSAHGNGRNLPHLTLGRTDSRRGLGFDFELGKRSIRFVLDREQVKELQEYLVYQTPRIVRERKRRSKGKGK